MRGLQHTAGDVGIGAALFQVGGELIHGQLELTFLIVGGAGAHIESGFGDDVFLAETATVDTGHGNGIATVEVGQQVVEDGLCFVQLLGVSARGVDQQIDRFILWCLLAATAEQ